MTVALVNNMPDSAFVDTEAQVRDLLAAGPEAQTIDLELFTITEIARSEGISAAIRSRYQGLDQLWTRAPDALIVTGTEPAQVQLPYEPYWPYLARLLEWAAESVPAVLLACVASQAAVLLFDRIERVPRAAKSSGVYAGPVTDPDDPLVAGMGGHVPMPHSRVNDLPEAAMTAAGYRIVVGDPGDGVGWSVAARRHGEAEFVLCQGHPEYATLSLLREYRRDVRRSLFGRGMVPYPQLPEGYLGPAATALLERFADEAGGAGEDPRELWERFPYDEVAATLENTWAAASSALYGNWLGLARAVALDRA